MNRDQVRQGVNGLAVILTIAVNGLANALPLNGKTTGEISDRFQVYFVPAGYAFSIWGVIYLGLIAFGVYQALPAQRANPRLQRVGYLFALSCAANIGWLFLWHYEQFVLTLVAMATLLGTLIAIYLRLGIGRTAAARLERACVDLPFSVYLGWITVATIANVTIVLDYLGWNGGGIPPELWAVILLIVAVGIAARMLFARGDFAYALVILWAVAGIAVKQAGTVWVAPAAWIAAGAVVVLMIARFFRLSNL